MDLFGRSRRRIRGEAADWVARLEGEASPGDLARFQQWYDRDPRHAQAYDRIKAIWDGAGKLQYSAPLAAASSPGRGLVPAFASLAAVFLIGLALLVPGSPLRPGSPTLLATAIGETRMLALGGGSKIRLGPASRIELLPQDSQLHVAMDQGAARYDATMAPIGFVVRISDYEVSGGGSFDVRSGPSRWIIEPVVGEVEIARAGLIGPLLAKRWTARPGDRIIIDEDGVRTEPSRLSRVQMGMIELRDRSLEDAVALINRGSQAKIRLASPSIGKLRLTGAYRQGDTRGFAQSAARAFNLRLETKKDGSILLS